MKRVLKVTFISEDSQKGNIVTCTTMNDNLNPPATGLSQKLIFETLNELQMKMRQKNF